MNKKLDQVPTVSGDPDVVRTGNDVAIMAPTATIHASFGVSDAADDTKEN